MEEPRRVIEGIIYYLKTLLLSRPRRRIIQKFTRKVMLRQAYEFKLYDVFLVHNVDVGALLVNSPRFYIYIQRYEREPVEILRCLLSRYERGLFVDIGAYVGFYTILAARHGWNVLAFEPNPLNSILLRYNIALHNVGDRVTIVDKAVGDKHSYSRFTIALSPSESSFTKYYKGPRIMDIIVEVVTLDSVIETLNIENNVNIVMKIDVEGFGLNVVKGAIKTIRRFKPFILFEIHRTFDELDEVNALTILKSLGYEYVIVEPRSTRSFIIYAYSKENECVCCK